MSGFYTPDGRFLATENGRPVVGAKLYVYLTGTTTPATTYKDSALTIPNTNPVIMDVQGRAVVVLDPAQAYDFVLKRADDSTISSQTNIILPASATALAAVSASVSAEAALRVAGDASNASAVSAEAAARAAADTALQNQITARNNFPWWEIANITSGVDDTSSLIISKSVTSHYGSTSEYNSGAGKFTVPQTGTYLVMASGSIQFNGTSASRARIVVNGVVKAQTKNTTGSAGTFEEFSLSTIVYCSSGTDVLADFTATAGGFGSGTSCTLTNFSLSRLH